MPFALWLRRLSFVWPGANRAAREISPLKRVKTATSRVQTRAMSGEMLLRVDTENSEWQKHVQAAAGLLPEKLFVFFKGGDGDVVSEGTMNTLAELYDAVVPVDPVLDVIPLMPCAGWDRDLVAKIPGLKTVAVAGDKEDAGALIREINSTRETAGFLPVTAATLPQLINTEISERNSAVQASVSGARSDASLQVSDAAVGGTFDHLHAGHRLLLASTALVTTRTVWLGIASDELLANKKNADQLETYDVREHAATGFLQCVNPGIRVRSGALTDPSEPPLAATLQEIKALVVSQETKSGAAWICNHRKQLGLSPIALVVVGLVGGNGKDPSSKLSSSFLREQQAARGSCF